jgi:hypothetical protein
MTSDSASRVTRSRRELRIALALFLGAIAAVSVLRAQETPPSAASEPPAAQAAAPEAPPPPAEVPAAKPASPPERKPGPSQGRFEPTEKVRADFDVSFPVDI